MRQTTTLMAALLLTAASGMAQTVKVFKTDGTVVTFPATEVDYIQFTAPSDEKPDDGDKTPEGVEAVDLGLPSGTLWANMNVGATSPEDYGDYYAWGETGPKDMYNLDTYKYYNSSTDDPVNIGSDIAGTSYDAATVNWGAPWRMPSLAQIRELSDNCTSEWTTLNGVYGRKFTGPNGGTIFLPAAGWRLSSRLDDAGSLGFYWSSALYESDPSNAYYLLFNSGYAYWSDYFRGYGLTVRPVRFRIATTRKTALNANCNTVQRKNQESVPQLCSWAHGIRDIRN